MDKFENPLLSAIQEAQRAQPFQARYSPGIETPQMLPKKAASLRTLTLAKTSVRVDKAGKIIVGSGGNMAGETISIEKAIFRGSRFAQAGGNLIFLPEHAAPVETGTTGVVAMRSEPVSFSVVSPAVLELVGDDENAPDGTLPVFVSTIDRAGQKNYGVNFKLSRADQKARGEQTTADELLASIVAGLSKVVDTLALQAILATTPGPFSLAAAAAAGVRFGDLRALVGADGAGAHVSATGSLVAWPTLINVQTGGILAELTDVMNETVIGDFTTAAAVIGPDLQILVSRMNKNGDVNITAWLSADAVCPAAGKFWALTDEA